MNNLSNFQSNLALLRGKWEQHPLLGPHVGRGPARPGERLTHAGGRNFAARLRPERAIEAILLALGEARAVLEVGARVGTLSRAVARACGGCTVLEPDPANVATLRSMTGLGLRVFQGRTERLPFAAGSFDAVLAAWVLQYSDHPGRAVLEMARVTRWQPGARIILVQCAPWNTLLRLYNHCARQAGKVARAHHGQLLAEAAAVLEQVGFSRITVAPIEVRWDLADLPVEQRFPAAVAMTQALHGFPLARLDSGPAALGGLRAAAAAGDLCNDGVLLVAERPWRSKGGPRIG